MLYTSAPFLLFLPIAFAVYWLLRNSRRLQNLWVVAASWFFYACWDWRFLGLIALTSVVSWLSGLGGLKVKVASVAINLAILGLFKYYDFFAAGLAALLGLASDRVLLHLVLPVGISFYTFQAIGYTIDVYKRRIEPTRDLVAYLAYVSFFPQLVAGPIERATNLLPQFLAPRRFDYRQAVDGLRQMLWGYFLKMAVADRCAVYVDAAWADYASCSGGQLLLAAVLFAVQIYGDFAGYSNIAIGCAKLFGISLRQNFRTPYFSRDIAEFWRRWHISLTTWFRDYLYIPLGGSRVGRWKVVRNTFIIFLVSGLWHGANWTFVAWGAFHAVLFLPLILLGRNRRHTDTVAGRHFLPNLREFGQMLLTFALTTLGWILFRAATIHDAVAFAAGLLDWSGGKEDLVLQWPTVLFIVMMTVVEWLNRDKPHGLVLDGVRSRPLRLMVYYALLACILLFSVKGENFIYFQF